MSNRSCIAFPPTFLSILLAAAIGCGPPTQADDDDDVAPDAGPGIDANNVDPPDAGGPPPDAWVPQNCVETFVLEGYTDASEVLLTGDFTTPSAWAGTVAAGAYPMTLGAGSWSVEVELEPGSYLYKFVIDGTTWIHDSSNPNTADDGYGGVNSVFECGSAPPTCGNPDEFDWRDAVMYFVMVDRFHDSDNYADTVAGASGKDAYGNSGQYEGGDLPGVRDKMGYLADLGVTAIWLSAPFENRDAAGAAIDSASDSHMYSGYHGYWPSPDDIDYSTPDNPSPRPQIESRLGNEADLVGLIDDAHSATSANADGIKVLFDYVMNHVDINSGLYAAHWDWFARDGDNFALCGPSNLWNDPYWGTRCAFTDYLPPLDLYNEQARNWSVNDAMWWAKEFGIDGYRLDAIKHVPLEWLTELRTRLNTEMTNPAGERFYLVGETFDYFDRDLLKQFIQPQTMLDGQFDFPFKRELCEAVFNPSGGLSGFRGFMDGNDGYYDANPDNTAIMTTWIGNHDIPRAIHFANWHFGNCTEGSHSGNGWSGDYSQPSNAEPYERLGLAFAIMLTNPGIPLIYYGDEIGLAGGGDPGNRPMMEWNDDQLNDHQKALRASVRTLARLRGEYKILGRGTRTTLHDDQDTWVYRMGGCGTALEEVVVAINRADDGRWVTIPAGSYTDEMTGADIDGGADYLIPARKFMVLTPR